MKTLRKIGALALVTCSFAVSQRASAVVVYSNTNTDLGINFGPGTFEVGDEILLGAGGRTITNFTFQYYGSNTTTVSADLRFYQMNGGAAPQGSQKPGTVLFDSGSFLLPAGTALNGYRATMIFDIPSIVVPTDFTWSIQFSGITANQLAELPLYSPPTIGQNYDDYWENTGAGGWKLKTAGGAPPINFAAIVDVQAVPEPSTMALGALGLGAFGLMRRRFSK